MSIQIHRYDVGTRFVGTVKDEDGEPVDVSNASTKEFTFWRPDGSTIQRACILDTDGLDGKIAYDTVDGDLDRIGYWKVQGHVVLTEGEWHTSIEGFRVHPNL